MRKRATTLTWPGFPMRIRSSLTRKRPNFLLPLSRVLFAIFAFRASTLHAQVPTSWRDSLVFHTFSIAAVDPRTGEVGVAVTTRVACVGNGVPWVRAGVGAVATQANTRTEYGNELLDLLGRGVSPDDALKKLLMADTAAATRQIGVIARDGRSAQHTGKATSAWAGHRAGPNYVTQGNLLVGPEVIDAVAQTFEASEGSARHLSDRLIEAIAAGNAKGGDARKGRQQSAAVIVADPRPGRARRPDGVTTNISVCENPDPVGELRRIFNYVSQTLGYRSLQQYTGNDIVQLKVMLHALGLFHPQVADVTRESDAPLYTSDAVAAVDAFRAGEKLSGVEAGSPPGWVDEDTVALLWKALERAGKDRAVREALLDLTAVRR